MARLDFDINTLKWNQSGILPVIVQCQQQGDILMLAWTNKESLRLSLQTGQAHYYSRSRDSLWRKGETSGHTQTLCDILVDCDKDSIIFKVQQTGDIACHTGRRSCFFYQPVLGALKEID